MKQVIFDVETKLTFDAVGGYYPEKLGISFIGAIERDGFPGEKDVVETEHQFFEQDLEKFWPVLESADVVIGFNSDGFDLPTLIPYYHGNIRKLPSLDLLARIKSSINRRISLDSLAKQTLGTKKSGNGLDAIKYFQEKQWDKLAHYCMKDVAITRDLYDYGRVNGKILYLNHWNNMVDAPVDFSFAPKPKTGVQMSLL
jgi:DEAD/DEAH box helicase domain-containing protein